MLTPTSWRPAGDMTDTRERKNLKRVKESNISDIKVCNVHGGTPLNCTIEGVAF